MASRSRARRRSPKRALVLGATGHLGQAIVRELIARDYRVTAATRQVHPAALEGLAVEVVTGDADDRATLDRWIEGHDLVIDAAAPYPLHMFARGGDPVEGARRRTTALLEGVRRRGAALGYVGSFTTMVPRAGGLLGVESDLRRTLHPYFEVKRVIEAMLVASDVRATIVNPTACLGPWDRKPRALSIVAQLLDGQLLATVRHAVNVVDVRDVAWLLVTALEAEVHREPILAAGHDVGAHELAARVAEIAGVRPPPFAVSLRATALAAFWWEAAWSMTGRAPAEPALGAFLLAESRAMPRSARATSLGLEPRPLDETLYDTVAWHRAR